MIMIMIMLIIIVIIIIIIIIIFIEGAQLAKAVLSGALTLPRLSLRRTVRTSPKMSILDGVNCRFNDA